MLDDAVDGGEAEAGALSDFLGGEERLENVRERLRGHAGAGVGHGEHDVATGLGARMFAAVELVELAIACFDLQLAAVGHGVARVDGEVHDDLLDLALIGFDAAERRIEIDVEAMSSPMRRGNIFCMSETRVLRSTTRQREDLLAAEGE